MGDPQIWQADIEGSSELLDVRRQYAPQVLAVVAFRELLGQLQVRGVVRNVKQRQIAEPQQAGQSETV